MQNTKCITLVTKFIFFSFVLNPSVLSLYFSCTLSVYSRLLYVYSMCTLDVLSVECLQ